MPDGNEAYPTVAERDWPPNISGYDCPWSRHRQDLTECVQLIARSTHLRVPDAIAAVAALAEDGIL